eukprot:10825917-Prorocentrum_lima.AAC.1
MAWVGSILPSPWHRTCPGGMVLVLTQGVLVYLARGLCKFSCIGRLLAFPSGGAAASSPQSP